MKKPQRQRASRRAASRPTRRATRATRATRNSAAIACMWGAVSDKGTERETNQDSYIGNGLLFAVADGLGGYEGGQLASRLAVNVLLRETFQASLPANWPQPPDRADKHNQFSPGTHRLHQAFQQANREIVTKSQSDLSLAAMSTTLCAMQLHSEAGTGAKYFSLANVGDSRIYLLSGPKLHQITIDHTYVNDLVRGGLITEEEAAVHKQRHELTRVLGNFFPIDTLKVDVWEVAAQPGDRYMLCTDGLALDVPDSLIFKLLNKYSNPQEAANMLLKAALDAGGRDNITVLVIDVVEAEQTADSP